MPSQKLPLADPPAWLLEIDQDWMINNPLPLRELLQGSLYYPSSSFDGDPVAYLAGNYLSFIYVDYGHNHNELLEALSERGFLGYRVLCNRSVAKRELTPDGWTPNPPMLPVTGFMRDWVQEPFCEWVILERDKGRPENHGPHRFSLLYLCADGVAAFQALYVGNRLAPAAVAIIQPGTGFGGKWTDFTDQNAPLAQSVLNNPAGLPDVLLYGGAGGQRFYIQPCWPQYSEKLGFLGNTSIGVWRLKCECRSHSRQCAV